MKYLQSASSIIAVPELICQGVESFASGKEAEREAGGILLGRYRGAHIELTGFTTPMPGDVRKRYSFERRDPGHGKMATAAWNESGRTITYVGEWHTHPEPYPTPSPTDVHKWAERIRRDPMPLVFLIRGYDRAWWGVGLGNTIKKLALADAQLTTE